MVYCVNQIHTFVPYIFYLFIKKLFLLHLDSLPSFINMTDTKEVMYIFSTYLYYKVTSYIVHMNISLDILLWLINIIS